MDRRMLKEIIDRYEAVTFTVNRRLNAMIREITPDGLTVEQYSTLRYLKERDAVTSSELAESFCVGKSSITAIVTRLTDKNLIRRVPDERDRRVIYLVLTEEGEQMANAMEDQVQDLLSRYMKHFDEKEAMAFIETFEKLGRVMLET